MEYIYVDQGKQYEFRMIHYFTERTGRIKTPGSKITLIMKGSGLEFDFIVSNFLKLPITNSFWRTPIWTISGFTAYQVWPHVRSKIWHMKDGTWWHGIECNHLKALNSIHHLVFPPEALIFK